MGADIGIPAHPQTRAQMYTDTRAKTEAQNSTFQTGRHTLGLIRGRAGGPDDFRGDVSGGPDTLPAGDRSSAYGVKQQGKPRSCLNLPFYTCRALVYTKGACSHFISEALVTGVYEIGLSLPGRPVQGSAL